MTCSLAALGWCGRGDPRRATRRLSVDTYFVDRLLERGRPVMLETGAGTSRRGHTSSGGVVLDIHQVIGSMTTDRIGVRP
jgi:hypothetical protein